MEVKQIPQKDIWEGFLAQQPNKTFLHSWSWGEFQKALGNKVWRLGIFAGAELVSVALVVKVQAKRGSFLLVPHGPVGAVTKVVVLQTLLSELKTLGEKEGVSFIRVNPIWERNEENAKVFSTLGFRPAPIQMHPEASWKLNITLSEDELFHNMRKTTKYLIRKAQSDPDISVSQGKSPEDIETFSKLHDQVSRRQHFVPFSLEYLQKEFSLFSGDEQVVLFWAKHKGQVGAGAFVVFWSGIGFYHHAVSLPEYAKLSLPYLLQWELIKEAKRRGCKMYDFWGYVDPVKQKGHPWAGPTLFKMGFGGEAHEYVKTQDFPLNRKYWLTYFFEMMRKIKRGL
ncbi:MAG: peptidoglycan bridge formation glycyltransferase FemA/FemB family protein [Candidatus Wildermuthbacteria bacterium]|nr:peptidoglycan bridge formation glycyltransferase FemA/FemB family protein [Candidatus Wildermuthbacteria bacterium]